MNRRHVAALVALACLAAGCASSSAQTPPSDAATATSEAHAMAVHLEASGAVDLEWSGQVSLRVAEVPVQRFLSVGAESVLAGPGSGFRFAFDLIGQYDGPGAYTVPVTGSGDPGRDLSAWSNTFLHWAPLLDPAGGLVEGNVGATTVFDQAEEPCTVVVGDQAASGSLSCPRLADDTGRAIEIRWTWQRVAHEQETGGQQ